MLRAVGRLRTEHAFIQRPVPVSSCQSFLMGSAVPQVSWNGKGAGVIAVSEEPQPQRLRADEYKSGARANGRGLGATPWGAVLQAQVASLAAAATATVRQQYHDEHAADGPVPAGWPQHRSRRAQSSCARGTHPCIGWCPSALAKVFFSVLP